MFHKVPIFNVACSPLRISRRSSGRNILDKRHFYAHTPSIHIIIHNNYIRKRKYGNARRAMTSVHGATRYVNGEGEAFITEDTVEHRTPKYACINREIS